MKDFDNTFISTEHLTREQLTSLYFKYIDVLEKSGCSVAYNKVSKFSSPWAYLYFECSVISYSDDYPSFLSKKCTLKEITEEDLDNYLKEQDDVSKYKYEPVTGLSISDVVEAMNDGEEFYYTHSFSEDYSPVSMDVSLMLLNRYINSGSLFRQVEVYWCDKYKGSLVAVRSYKHLPWQYDVFEEYNKTSDYPFQCKRNWKFMRPLTQAEKDSIITKD